MQKNKIYVDQFNQSVTEFDKKVFLICYNAAIVYKVKKNSKEGKYLDALVDAYKNYIVTGNDKHIVEKYLKGEKYATGERVSFHSVKPGILVGSGSDDVEEIAERKLLMEITDKTMDSINNKTEQEKHVDQRMNEIEKNMNDMMLSMVKNHEEVFQLLKDISGGQNRVEKMTKKNLQETLKLNPQNLSTKDWVVDKMTGLFKNIVLFTPIATFKLAKKTIYWLGVEPVVLVTEFYKKKIQFIIGHVYIIIIAGFTYYIYLHITEDESIKRICEDDPSKFMCSATERTMVYGTYKYFEELLKISKPYANQIGFGIVDSSFVGLGLAYEHLKNNVYNSSVSIIKNIFSSATGGWLF